MNRRTLLAVGVTSTAACYAGCISRHDIPVLGNPKTVTEELDTTAARTTTLYGLDCDIDSPDETTAVSATEIGHGDGQHYVSLLVDGEESTPTDIEIVVDSELVHEESVELGNGRYTYYEFKHEAAYSLFVTVDGEEVELEIEEDHIEASEGGRMRSSGQTFCVTPDGEVSETGWMDD